MSRRRRSTASSRGRAHASPTGRRRHPPPTMILIDSPLTADLSAIDEMKLESNLAPGTRTAREDTAMANELATEIRAYIDERINYHIDKLEKVLEAAFDVQNAAIMDISTVLANLPRPKADVADRCVHFLESHPGIRFNPTSVAENIDAPGKDVAAVLKRLAGNGRISVRSEPGRHPLYFVS